MSTQTAAQQAIGISYTFGPDAPAALRGMRCTGGEPWVAADGTRVVRFAERVNGKRVCARIAGRPELEQIVTEYERAQAEAKQREAAAQTARIAAIRSGEIPIRPSWRDGEYLSGWAVYGEDAELLRGLGIAEEVGGWGWMVPSKHIDALGEIIFFPAAAAYAATLPRRRSAQEIAADEDSRERKLRASGLCPRCRTWCYGDCEAHD